MTKLPPPSFRSLPLGLRIARYAGLAAGAFLLAEPVTRLLTAGDAAQALMLARHSLLFVLGLLLLLPWRRIRGGRPFSAAFAALLVCGGLFVFSRVVEVILAYSEAVRAGGDPGLPAFSGVLIFLVLMQIPVVLFIRNPAMLD